MRPRSRSHAQHAARDAKAFAMPADVFHRHGSLALLINAGAACGHSFADWKPVEKSDRPRRCKITGPLETARVVDYAERITNGRESRFLSPRAHLATDR